jgi:hypothetical protein
MKLEKIMRKIGIVFIAMCVAVPLVLQADVYIKQKNHTDGFSMMGQSQPPKDDIFVTWMSKDKARMDHGEETTIIIRMDKNVMYMINHKEKKYTEMPIGSKGDIFSSAMAGSDLSGEEQAQAKKMMEGFAKMMKPKVSVKDTGETKKIKNWNCKKYIMTMSMMGTTTKFDTWASEDIKIDYELYRNLTFSVMGQTPGIEDMMKEMEKIKGVVVLQEGTMSMMGTDVKSTNELLEVSEKSAPAGTYEVSSQYKKQN